jgi:heme-degrading monooxygenase HmoA
MWVKRDALHTFSDIYAQSVMPALRGTDGCLFAALVQDVRDHNLCASLTMWRTREKAAEYERSGLFEHLVSILRHLFQDPSGWGGTNLSDDLHLDFAPTPERPSVVGFENQSVPEKHSPTLPYFTHLLSLKSRSDKVGEFRQHYTQNILSLYSPQKGFMDAFLMHRIEEHHMFYILSFWDGTADPSDIMRNETVDEIVDRSRDVLSTVGSEAAGKAEDGEGTASHVYRCLRAEWFAKKT